MNTCKYKNAFGKPGKGFHFHVFGIAIFDLLATLIIAWIISRYTKAHFLLVLFIILIITVVIHRIFCVNTTFNKLIFGEV